MCGLDLSGDRPHETPLWDLEEDAARIRTSFRQAYGIEWDEGAVASASPSSWHSWAAAAGPPLGAAIHYRNPATKPKPTKYNRQEVEAWNAAHKAFELGKGRSSHGSEEGSDAAMRDVRRAQESDEVSMDGNVIIKAVLDTVDVSKNIKALERDLQGISWKNITEGDEKAAKLSSSFKKAGTAATVTLTAPVVAAGKAVFGVASDYEQGQRPIAAAFGVSGEEAERFSGIGKRIYEGGWGESLDEVNDALIQCKSTLRDVSDEDLQTVTTNALMLSDTFGADVNESIRGTNAPHGGLRAVRHRGQRPADGGHAARPELHRRAGRQPERILRAMGRGGNERQRVLRCSKRARPTARTTWTRWATTSTSS